MEYHSGGSLPLLGRPRYCPGANTNGGYLCETGHCCGETGCCTYYYELWWFWLLWTVLILFSCCCAYRHRRAKLRDQQQQRQREISMLAYHGASSYPSSMLDLSFLASLKLPSYEEVAAQPSTPPPPYSSVFTAPRYPQPPRTVDPHLLTQHGPLLHCPHSDGPSSLSSDNSSSCSCDSCCPSSPCSSSLSAPVTYETDTSHASTPSEAAPLTLDVTMETITAAATRLEVSEERCASERMVASVVVDINDVKAARAQEPLATDPSVPNQTVTVAVVTRAASPQPSPSPSPSSEVALPLGTTPSVKRHLDLTPCITTTSTCSSNTLPSPRAVEAAFPSIQIITTEGPADGLETTVSLKTTSTSSPSTPTESTSDRPGINLTLETLNPTGSFNAANVPCSPALVPSPDVERTLALITDFAVPLILDPNPALVPIPAPSTPPQALTPVPSNLSQATMAIPSNSPQALTPTNFFKTPSNLTETPEPVPTNQAGDAVPINLPPSPAAVSLNLTPLPDVLMPNHTQFSGPVPLNISPESDSQSKTTLVPDSAFKPVPTPVHSNLSLATDAAAMSSTLAFCKNPELPPGSGLISVSLRLPQQPGTVAVLASSLDPDAVPAELVLSQLPASGIVGPLPLNTQGGFSSGAGSRSGSPTAPTPVLTFLTSASPSSCPAINIEPECLFGPPQSPPSSPSSLPSPPFPTSPPALTSTLLLDPLTALHQSEKGGSSSGHASSLSPSPRATQSPPKQTLFSPCVDIFEPGPPEWEDGEEEQEDNDDDEEDDMGADESQYRHRRLTGDSGIEVCRCRVEKEDDEEEEEEKREEEGRRGGGEKDKKGGGSTDLHDSVDCPARGQRTAGEELTLCTPTSTTTPTSEDCGEVVIVMETV
ncbi:hypothetical protein JOB18_020764 [Solea senegalensis]|uniref:Uncharacterized protein n=1 Tax=Solea senegalensis TaxID=28829 RepID=A0AAV6QWQ9_SOLSE|nr:mucin-5AC-like isoform X1 [Solea senegalensis]KAG7496531.1 hypothetical protein JOB18_020764 [Solea senegalensis]